MMMQISMTWTDPVNGSQRESRSHTDSADVLHKLVDEYVERAQSIERTQITIGTVTQEQERNDLEDVEE